jgi:sec-independent protein translocase protein TatB
MLPEVGALEWLIIAAVALIVVGPKDLPVLMRRLGQFVARLRGMASEFRASFDEMARQSELDDLRKEVEAMRRGQFGDISAHDEMRSTVSDIERSMSDVGVSLNGPETWNYDAEVAAAPPPPLTIAEGPKPEKKPRAAKAKANGAAKPAAAKTAAPKTAVRKTAVPKTAAPKAAAKPATARKAAPKPVMGRTPRATKTVVAGS